MSEFWPLEGLRVLDLTTARAEMAGRCLADLGASVLKLEPPDGSEARRIGPFDEGDGESLYWASVGLGKKSAVLDLETAAGRDHLRDLASRADVLVESFDPGWMRERGLDADVLRGRNRRLIYCSVTPFGQRGPRAHWPTTEMTLEAAGGRVALQGDLDRPPLPMGYPQTAFHAGAQAAADVIVALNERALSGEGQILETSMFETMVWTLFGTYQWPLATGQDPPGTADDRDDESARSPLARLFPGQARCADGWLMVALSPLGQSRGGGMVPLVMADLEARGVLDDELRIVDWSDWEAWFNDGRLREDQIHLAVRRTHEFLARRTKEELITWTLENKLRLGAVRTIRELLDDEHLTSRSFFQEIGDRTHPGLPYRVSADPLPLREPAPALDEHQEEVSRWLTEPPLVGERRAPAVRTGEAFAGIRVADFSWVVAGPTIGKALADHGATVVRVESSKRLDLARKLPPHRDDEPTLNSSHWAGMYNTSKKSLALDLGTAEGRRVARRLADWADVVLDSFSPGTMARLGLDWEALSQERDDLICLSTSLFGSGGRLSPYVGFGQQATAMIGLHGLTGWPDLDDRAPCGPYGPYTDVVAPKFGIAALAAAILERRRTGKGRRIELSQAETGIRFAEPVFLDESVNGRSMSARGMASDRACPHGVFASYEKERYVAVAVETVEQWRSLCAVIEPPDDVARDASLARRLERREEVERGVADWIAARSCWDAERKLIAAGVPAAVVRRPSDLYNDEQLEARGFREVHRHAELGELEYDGFATRFSAKEEMLRGPTPCLGEHSEWVLRELLELPDDEIRELSRKGILS